MHFNLYNKYLRYLYLLQASSVCYNYINIQLYWFLIVNVRVNFVFRCIYYDGICLLSLVIFPFIYITNIYDICICYSLLYLQNPRNISQSHQPNKRTLWHFHLSFLFEMINLMESQLNNTLLSCHISLFREALVDVKIINNFHTLYLRGLQNA